MQYETWKKGENELKIAEASPIDMLPVRMDLVRNGWELITPLAPHQEKTLSEKMKPYADMFEAHASEEYRKLKEKPDHEIEGWKRGIFFELAGPGCPLELMLGTTVKKVMDIFSREREQALTHQKESIVSKLEGKLGNDAWGCGRYDKGIADAIDVVRGV